MTDNKTIDDSVEPTPPEESGTPETRRALWKDIGPEVKWTAFELGIAYAGVGMAIAGDSMFQKVGSFFIGIGALGLLYNIFPKIDAIELLREYQMDPGAYMIKYHNR